MGDILTYAPEVLSLCDPRPSIHFFPDSFEFIPIILSMGLTMFLPSSKSWSASDSAALNRSNHHPDSSFSF